MMMNNNFVDLSPLLNNLDAVPALREDNVQGDRVNIVDGERSINSAVKTVCLWRLGLKVKSEVWAILHKILPVNIMSKIISLERICQRSDYRVRYEVTVPRDMYEITLEKLVSARRQYDMIVRPYRRWIREEIPRIVREFSDVALRIGTWNIRGTKGKRGEIEHYLNENRLDILGLQETLKTTRSWSLRYSGYQIVEVPVETLSRGNRGLALLIRNEISAYPVGTSSTNWIFTRVFGHGINRPFIVGTVYLPHQHVAGTPFHDSSRIKREFKAEVLKLHRDHPGECVVVMGDFNMKGTQVDTFCNSLNMSRATPVTGSVLHTYHSAGRSSDLDHIIITDQYVQLVSEVIVDDSTDLSDHHCVSGQLKYLSREILPDGFQLPKKTWKVRKLNPLTTMSISNNPLWTVFYDEMEDDMNYVDDEGNLHDEDPLTPIDDGTKLNRARTMFIQTCESVGEENKVFKTQPKRSGNHPHSKLYKRACNERRSMYIAYKNAKRVGSVRQVELLRLYRAKRAETTRMCKADQRARWCKAVVQAFEDRSSDPKELYRWANDVGNWKKKSSTQGVIPIRTNEGVLVTNPVEIGNAWKHHYQILASDITGHSRDQGYWEGRLEDHFPPNRDLPLWESLNEEISMEEMLSTLRDMKRNKASGQDGIPVDLFVLGMDLDDQGSDMHGALLSMLQLMWTTTLVPDGWNTSTVVSIFKKGDISDPTNYRGISLQDSAVKILMSILTTRLTKLVNSEEILSMGQAGFRENEECLGQVCTVAEIVKRRFNMKNGAERTYALFLDFKKAYDVVPHAAMFAKLQTLGVTGRFLDFVRNLYRTSKVQVRLGNGSLSDPFDLERGLRQGCPMSPILFNIFINDLFEGANIYGTSVPGIQSRIEGLLFADDALALSGNVAHLASILGIVKRWAEIHEMTFGVDKCGLMIFQTIEGHELLNEDEIFRDKTIWSIHGQDIPIVKEYCYLGVMLTPNLCPFKMAKARQVIAMKTLYSLENFFRSPTISVKIRVQILKSIVLPTSCYGGELWGLNRKITAPMQRVVSLCCRWILNIRGPASMISKRLLSKELDIDPECVPIAVRRTRAYIKYANLKTWIAELVTNPARTKKKSWVTQTEFWLNRYINPPFGDCQVGASWKGEGSPPFISDIDAAMHSVRLFVRDRESNIGEKNAPVSNKFYNEGRFKSFHVKEWFPHFGQGLLLLSQFRCSAYDLLPNLARCKLVAAEYSMKCFFCKQNVPESAYHLVFECMAWRDHRRDCLGPLLGKVTGFFLRYRRQFVALGEDAVRQLKVRLMLGGGVEYNRIANNAAEFRLASWKPRVLETDNCTATFLDGDVEGRKPLWTSCGCYRIASFLTRVHSQRQLLMGMEGGIRNNPIGHLQNRRLYQYRY